MSDKEGKLSAKEKQIIEEWLAEKWKQDVVCPVSKHNNWIVGDYLVRPLTETANGTKIGGPGFPFAVLICGGCGYTLFFNAVVMGLRASKEKRSTEGDSNGDE